MLLSGHGLAQIRDATTMSYGYRWHNTIHQAIGVYMHWVIPGRELEYQALGYILNKTTSSCIHVYTQQNTVPGTYRIK